MRTTLNIPDDIISEVQNITKEKSKTKAICKAMKEYIRTRKIEKLISLQGKLRIKDVTDELEKLEIEEIKSNEKKWHNR